MCTVAAIGIEGYLLEEPPPRPSEPYAAASILFAVAVLTLAVALVRRKTGRRPKPSTGPDRDPLPQEDVDRLDAGEPLAVLLVGGNDDLGPHIVRALQGTHRDAFRQTLFVSVGKVDANLLGSGWEREFKGSEAVKRLRGKTRRDLDSYLAAAHHFEMKADCRVSIHPDPIEEMASLAGKIVATYPRSVFMIGKLVFEKPRWFCRLFQKDTNDDLRSCLERRGISVTVLPVVVRS